VLQGGADAEGWVQAVGEHGQGDAGVETSLQKGVQESGSFTSVAVIWIVLQGGADAEGWA
jgi:hypothetical protein